MRDAAQTESPAPRKREPGTSQHKCVITSHPVNAQRILSRADLPKTRDPAKYLVEDATGKTPHTFQKRERQVLEALLRGPLFCASPVRLGPAVQHLREAMGAGAILTHWHESREGDDHTRYGTYHLAAKVRRAMG